MAAPNDAKRPIIIIKKKGRPRRPPWRRVEGRLRRFRDRHDGVVHRALADEQQQADSGSSRRIL